MSQRLSSDDTNVTYITPDICQFECGLKSKMHVIRVWPKKQNAPKCTSHRRMSQRLSSDDTNVTYITPDICQFECGLKSKMHVIRVWPKKQNARHSRDGYSPH
ncbi:hypothetical protein Glove_58g99 [Diversispora epigaea]|uniref:Uncharacterized protein n=1 Tax=Diversispora epigaea TaxID=1348612 RepID=A0A397JC60_9GLOM|nr:hypothetical protein Glove_58g99 [Diversispora epigaea]